MGLFGFGKPKEEKIIDLQVLEGYDRNERRGTISIDSDTMDLLYAPNVKYYQLSTEPDGFFIEINNDPFGNEAKQFKRKVTAKFSPLFPRDEGKGIIRINYDCMLNGKMHLNNIVSVKQVPAYFAETVVVEPLVKRGDTIRSEYVRGERLGHTVYKNEIFMMDMLNLPFLVIGVSPARKSGSYALVVNEHTRFVIAPSDRAVESI